MELLQNFRASQNKSIGMQQQEGARGTNVWTVPIVPRDRSLPSLAAPQFHTGLPLTVLPVNLAKPSRTNMEKRSAKGVRYVRREKRSKGTVRYSRTPGVIINALRDIIMHHLSLNVFVVRNAAETKRTKLYRSVRSMKRSAKFVQCRVQMCLQTLPEHQRMVD